MLDLFGNDRPYCALQAAPAVQLGLVEHAAEHAALRSGRPVSQERCEILAPIERERCEAAGERGSCACHG